MMNELKSDKMQLNGRRPRTRFVLMAKADQDSAALGVLPRPWWGRPGRGLPVEHRCYHSSCALRTGTLGPHRAPGPVLGTGDTMR